MKISIHRKYLVATASFLAVVGVSAFTFTQNTGGAGYSPETADSYRLSSSRVTTTALDSNESAPTIIKAPQSYSASGLAPVVAGKAGSPSEPHQQSTPAQTPSDHSKPSTNPTCKPCGSTPDETSDQVTCPQYCTSPTPTPAPVQPVKSPPPISCGPCGGGIGPTTSGHIMCPMYCVAP